MATIQIPEDPLAEFLNNLPQFLLAFENMKLQRDQFTHKKQQDTIIKEREGRLDAEKRDADELALIGGLEGAAAASALDSISMESQSGSQRWDALRNVANEETLMRGRIRTLISTPDKDLTEADIHAGLLDASPAEATRLTIKLENMLGITLQKDTESLFKSLGYGPKSNPMLTLKANKAFIPTAVQMVVEDMKSKRKETSPEYLNTILFIANEQIVKQQEKMQAGDPYDKTYLSDWITIRDDTKNMMIRGVFGEDEGEDDRQGAYPKLDKLSPEDVASLKAWLEGNGLVADNQSMERLLNDPDFDIPDSVFSESEQEPVTEPDIIEDTLPAFFPEGFDLTRDMPF